LVWVSLRWKVPMFAVVGVTVITLPLAPAVNVMNEMFWFVESASTVYDFVF